MPIKATPTQISVGLEAGKTRVFASALEWPGWTRSGRNETSALEALLGSAGRYGQAIRTARLGFRAPTDVAHFDILERLSGTATDFGAPDVALAVDAAPLDTALLKRLSALMDACWQALQGAAHSAEGKALRTGPRGGGRALDKIVQHVVESNTSYLGNLNWKVTGTFDTFDEAIETSRRATSDALKNAAAGNVPEAGPRGGKRWKPRYYVRRAAWHILDHAWEIEDRST